MKLAPKRDERAVPASIHACMLQCRLLVVLIAVTELSPASATIRARTSMHLPLPQEDQKGAIECWLAAAAALTLT